MPRLKDQILKLLSQDDIQATLPQLLKFPLRKIINPLFGALLNPDPKIKWHGVSGFGCVTNALAQTNVEDARIIMRRCMWMLNDESGGIGWGIPEAMGESMALNAKLADEYHSILFSYLREDSRGKDNFLEYAPLRRGAFWGTARLAQARPKLAITAQDKIENALSQEKDEYILAYCLLYQQILGLKKNKSKPLGITLRIYWNYQFINFSV